MYSQSFFCVIIYKIFGKIKKFTKKLKNLIQNKKNYAIFKLCRIDEYIFYGGIYNDLS